MANLGDVVKIKSTDYQAILDAYPGSVTISGVSVTYDPNNIYLVEEDSDSLINLWTNTSPSSSFSAGSITLNQDAFNFKYLVFEYKEYMADDTSTFKTVLTPSTIASSTAVNTNILVRLSMNFITPSNLSQYTKGCSRSAFLTSSTSIYFTQCNSSDTQPYNTCCIPVNIYGTNNLSFAQVNDSNAYPPGAIYMSVYNVSPAILFGGTWESLGQIKLSDKIVAGNDTGSAWSDYFVLSTAMVGGNETALYTPATGGAITNTYGSGTYQSGELYYRSGLTLNGTSVYAWKRIS